MLRSVLTLAIAITETQAISVQSGPLFFEASKRGWRDGRPKVLSRFVVTLLATIHFSPFTGKCFTDNLTHLHSRFFCSKKARFFHSHAHLVNTRADASLIHSIHANIFTPCTRIVATKVVTAIMRFYDVLWRFLTLHDA